jgi:predicted dehydrogenase
MPEVFGLGLAGAGWLGECLLKELPAFPELRLAGVQDVAGDLAREVGAHYESPWTGERFEDLLAAPGVDAVILCTPNFCHAAQAIAALEAGKHVLAQKPLALTAASATTVVEAAKASGTLLLVDCSYRFLETVRVLEDTLPRIAPVRRVSARFHNIYGPGKGWCFNRAQSGGGALIDLGVHLLDLALHLLGPAEVAVDAAELTCEPGAEVESTAALVARLDEIPLEVAVSWGANLPQTEIGLTLEGERGTLAWENVDGSFFRFRTQLDGETLLERETALRDDTLRAFSAALRGRGAELPDVRVHELIDAAYAF